MICQKQKREKKKKNWALTGCHLIQHTVLSAQHHCLPLLIQMYCIQGHISSPHTLGCVVIQRLVGKTRVGN